MSSQSKKLFAVILAGGKGSRMDNQDKPLVELDGKPLIEWGLEKIQDEVDAVVLSVNHNPERYRYLNLPLIPDVLNNYAGPLVGIYSAMHWINENVTENTPVALLCIPADVPLFPDTLIQQLWNEFAKASCDVVWCQSTDQLQPLFSIWSLSCIDKLKEAIEAGLFGPKLVMPSLNNRLITVEPSSKLDFFNINDEKTLKIVQEMIISP